MLKGVSMKKILISGFVILAVLLMIQPGTAAEIEGMTQENPWNGTWVDESYTMYIQQDEDGITAIYQPVDPAAQDPGRLEGTVSDDGKVFSGRWAETGNTTLTLSEDQMSFSGIGTTTQIEGLPPTVAYEYNATRSGEVEDPENIWAGEWASDYKTYNLTQDGMTISGENHPLPDVEDEDGLYEGTVSEDGKTATISWIETGDFTFTLSEDGRYFNGTYTIDLSPSDESWSWNMTKNL